MTKTPNPYEPLSQLTKLQDERAGRSIPFTWIAFYLAAFVLLLFTMPATSHSDNWSGIFPAFGILMFGAYRLARAGALPSTAFLYGCSTSFLFLFRFLSMGRFRLWLEFRAPSTTGLVVMWIAICLFLGGCTAGVASIVRDEDSATDDQRDHSD
ncbi:hypothetical protein CA13_11110 [Planctomycetes bacterium CA13]|uniref:Transmembrane protein n=1 Tax=Novipirellula herctigrandis TaxID=2527986 RepID=A0A5C5YXF1_9BACT|nr:hypothetical protein CA13_11110 [Planctomycetes bacterium CA13]